MKTILVLALFLAGCAGLTYDAENDEGRVHRAAISWVGAPVDDMISAWGEPNNLSVEATEVSDGLVRWRKVHQLAVPNSATGASSQTCIVEAYFGLDGTINRVETMSASCDETYTAEELEQLTR